MFLPNLITKILLLASLVLVSTSFAGIARADTYVCVDAVGVSATPATSNSKIGTGVPLPTEYCPAGLANCGEAQNQELKSSATKYLSNTLLKLLGGVLSLSAIAAVLMLVIAGVRLVLAHGEADDIKKAHKQILWIVGGLLIIILSLIIVRNLTKVVYDTIPTGSGSVNPSGTSASSSGAKPSGAGSPSGATGVGNMFPSGTTGNFDSESVENNPGSSSPNSEGGEPASDDVRSNEDAESSPTRAPEDTSKNVSSTEEDYDSEVKYVSPTPSSGGDAGCVDEVRGVSCTTATGHGRCDGAGKCVPLSAADIEKENAPIIKNPNDRPWFSL